MESSSVQNSTLIHCHKVPNGRFLNLDTKYVSFMALNMYFVLFLITMLLLLGIIGPSFEKICYDIILCAGCLVLFYVLTQVGFVISMFMKIVYKNERKEIARLLFSRDLINNCEVYKDVRVSKMERVKHEILGVQLTKVTAWCDEEVITFYTVPTPFKMNKLKEVHIKLGYSEKVYFYE